MMQIRQKHISSIAERVFDSDWEMRFKPESTVSKETVYIAGESNYTLSLRYCRYTVTDDLTGHAFNYVIYELQTDQPFKADVFNDNENNCHPFLHVLGSTKYNNEITSSGNKLIIGEINDDNILMHSLFELIMQNDDDLGKSSGRTDSRWYRSHLVEILTSLWS